MAAMTSQKAYLYETSGSATGRANRDLDYKLEGHHAKLESRESLSIKGKFALSIGKKLDLKKEKENLVTEKKKEKQLKIKPVILPKCKREDSDMMEDGDNGETTGKLKRENTEDVPLTAELLENEITAKRPSKFCSACAKHYISKENENFSKLCDSLDIKQCELCLKQQRSINNSTKEDKTLLMSIVYPHDFYDRYQSVRRQFNNFQDDCEKKRERKKTFIRQKTILPKTTFTLPEVVNEGDKVILKPHVVKIKDNDKEDKVIEPDAKYSDFETRRTQNLHTEVSVSSNQLKHFRCQPRMKAYFLAALTSKTGVKERTSYFEPGNSFKGLFLSNTEKLQKPKPIDIKHSFYNVGSLGLTIGIPEYNNQIRSRQNVTSNYLSRTCTSLTELNRPQSLLPPLKSKVRPPGSLGHRSM